MQSQPQLKQIQEYVYDPSKPLGKGAFGAVYKATNTKNNQEVAVKVIPSVKVMQGGKFDELLFREINIHKTIKSEHVVRLVDVKRSANNLYLFTDLCEDGDLEKKLKKGHNFTEEEACDIVRQITDAFVSMGNVMHRDIKPANVLLSKGKVKVADFGFAKAIDEIDKEIRLRHTILGTPLYMPPQILAEISYSPKCDIWSTGCLFYEILFRKTPWTGTSVPNLLQNIKNKPLTFPKEVRPETKDLLKRMLEYEEANRISWEEIWLHPATNISSNSEVKEEPKNEIQIKQVKDYVYNEGKPISQNAFCKVYKATNTKNNQEVAVRVFPGFKITYGSKFDELMQKEINIQKTMNNENIVHIFDFERAPNDLYIISDFYEGENLENKFQKGQTFSEEESCDIIRQIADIFAPLGEVIHGDLNPTNLLLKAGKIKIADFAFGKVIREVEKESKLNNSHFYMSPQTLSGKPCNVKCDIWSIGCVFYEALFGQTPWIGSSAADIAFNMRTRPLVFRKKIKAETEDLLKRMLEYDEGKRISWEEIWLHPATNIVINN